MRQKPKERNVPPKTDDDFKVSIIIPAYNAAEHLHKCLNSVVGQTYKNIEIILLNDGSIDDTDEICKLYVEKYPEIKYIKKDNSGVSDTRNVGLELATGNWIMFVDADDWIEPFSVEEAVRIVEKNPGVDLVFNDIFLDDAPLISGLRDGVVRSNYSLMEGIINFDYAKKKYGKTFNGFRGPVGKIYNADVIKKCDIRYNVELKFFEDGLFNLQYIDECKKIYFSSRPFYHYVTNSQSVTHAFQPDRIEQSELIIENVGEFLRKKNIQTESFNYCVFNELCHVINQVTIAREVTTSDGTAIVREFCSKYKKFITVVKYKYLFIKRKMIFFLVKHKLLTLTVVLSKLKNYLKGKR